MNPAAQMLLVFWVLFGLRLAWSVRGVFWLQRGDYRRERGAYERQPRAWTRSVRDVATYNLALRLFLEDRLEEALVALDLLDSDAILPAVSSKNTRLNGRATSSPRPSSSPRRGEPTHSKCSPGARARSGIERTGAACGARRAWACRKDACMTHD